MAGDLQTPFSSPACPTPSGAAAGGGTSGGYDLPDGRKETPNMGAIPLLPTTVDVNGAPGASQVEWPPVASPGTIPTGETGGNG